MDEHISDRVSDRVKVENIVKPSGGGIWPMLMGSGHQHMYGGLGTGFVGGLIGSALFGRRGGLFGGCDGDGGGAASVVSAVGTEKIVDKLGNIQQEIAEVGANTTQAITSLQYQGALANCQNFGEVKMQIAQGNAAVISNNDQNTFRVLEAIAKSEADRMRAEINNLQLQMVQVKNEASAAASGNQLREQITITNNNAANANAVAVAKADSDWRARIECALAHTQQIAQATNQSLIIGNSGPVRGGNQTANPTNVNA